MQPKLLHCAPFCVCSENTSCHRIIKVGRHLKYHLGQPAQKSIFYLLREAEALSQKTIRIFRKVACI